MAGWRVDLCERVAWASPGPPGFRPPGDRPFCVWGWGGSHLVWWEVGVVLPAVNWSDPRLQPWAYLASRGRLFEVVEVDRMRGVLVENCRDGGRLRVGPREIVPGWRLVRAAPRLEEAA